MFRIDDARKKVEEIIIDVFGENDRRFQSVEQTDDDAFDDILSSEYKSNSNITLNYNMHGILD